MNKQRLLLSTAAAVTLGIAVPLAASARAASADLATAQDVAIGDPVAQTVFLALRKPAAAEAYAQAVQTPGNASFHKFLSVAQFVARFAPTAADIAKVESALVQLGYTVSSVFPNHLAIQVVAPAGTTEQAMGIKLKRLTVSGHTGMVPVGTVTLPASISGLVRGIGGLDTLRVPRPLHVKVAGLSTSTPHAAGTALVGGTPGNYLPADFAARYDVNPIYANGITGRGTTIGIVTLANFKPADAYEFWSGIGLSVDPNRITVVDVDGGTAIAPSDALGEGETDIDVEESGGLAPGAAERVYVAPNAGNDFTDAFEAAASENIADTVSTSWGEAELDYFAEPSQGVASQTYILDAFHDVFLEMNIQGQSLYAAAGDSGAFDTVDECFNYGTPSAKNPVCDAPYAVDAPANDPAVTAAGGTTIPFTTTFMGDTLSVAQERAWGWDYIVSETADQPTPFTIADEFSTGGGGGVSSYFRVPYYQKGVSGIDRTRSGQSFTQDTGSGPQLLVTLPAKFAGRNVPDIATNADPFSGYQFIEEGAVQNGYGGTSFVAPQLNGVTALAVQGLGGRVGSLNNLAYGFGITGTDDNAAGDNWGYDAVAGYDDATGLGTLNASRLADRLLQLKALYGR